MAQVKVVMKQRQLDANGEDHRQRPHTNDSFCFEEKRLEDWCSLLSRIGMMQTVRRKGMAYIKKKNT